MLLERDAALQTARDAIAQARQGRGATVLVSGEAGIGKTTLIEQVLVDAAPALRVFQGGCEDMTSARPLGPLRDIALAHALPLTSALDESAPVDVVFSSFLDLLAAGPRATVVVFEDVHWADQATLDLKWATRSA